MAKFRKNHARTSKAKGLSYVKIILFVLILGVVLFYLSKVIPSINIEPAVGQGEEIQQVAVFDFSKDSILSTYAYLPIGSEGEIVHHKHYSLAYLEKYEQAEWVSYELTKESIRRPNVPRAKRFEDDPFVSTGSATYYDYRGSGFSRGHLAPAGDMAFDQEAMQESFFMSNMSPQLSSFNGGIWNELENLARDWAYKNEKVYIVSGPILNNVDKYIGKNKIAVPKSFYKIILDVESREQKAIAFLIPNEKSEKRLQEFAVSIDRLEELTGLDFFGKLLDLESQEKLESKFDLELWPFDEALYQKRVNNWNNR